MMAKPLNKKGSVIVEFAIVAVIITIITFAIIDLALIFYVNLTMQHAVRQGTRYAVTGQKNPGDDRRASMIAVIRNNSNGLYDKNMHSPKDPEIKVLTTSDFTSASTGSLSSGEPGNANEFIVVSLTYSWPVITPILKPLFEDGRYTFTVRSAMKNEPF